MDRFIGGTVSRRRHARYFIVTDMEDFIDRVDMGDDTAEDGGFEQFYYNLKVVHPAKRSPG